MKVRLRRDGSLLSVLDPKPAVRSILERVLTYDRLRLLRGQEAREAQSNVEVIPTEVFEYIVDEDGIMAPQLVTPSGYLTKIVKTLRTAGHQPVLIEAWRHPRPQIFDQRWDRISDIQLRWRQDHILRQMGKHPCGRILCPTGYGKSFMLVAACRLWHKAKIDITTHSNDVIEQLYYLLERYIPNVGLVTGKKKRRDCRVTCYSGKSLHHSDADADILIVDEVHEFGTDDYLEKVARYRYARKYGLSANQGDRIDGTDFELWGAFGPLIAKVTYQEAVAHNCVVPIEVHWRDVISDVNPCEGAMGTAKERHGIWRNEQRNKLIAQDARSFGKDEQVLVTVATIEHAMFLKEHLPEFYLCYSEDGMTEDERAKYINWGLISDRQPIMTADRRAMLKQAFETGRIKKAIATTVWKRGVDFRGLSVLIRADAQSSAIADTQIPGRTSRTFEEGSKEKSIVIDYLDQFDPGYRKKAQTRAQTYSRHGWTQIKPRRGRSKFQQAYLNFA